MAKLADLWVKLGLKNEEFNKEIDKSKKKTSAFANNLKKIGGAIAGAFAVGQIIDFGKEVIKLSAEAEGVERAFNRIGGQEIFEEIKEATRGTVSNLELMRKTVSAQQLGVPIEQLGKLFEFATARAADTGESVDFLVQSIVTGIGRKSPLILDNLGISAIALKEKLGDVGLQTASVGDVAKAVGAIATEELNKIGDAATTNAQKIQSLSASWDNLKLSIGKVITESNEFKFIASLIGDINTSLTGQAGKYKEARAQAEGLFNTWKESGRLTPEFIKKQTDLLKEQKNELIKGNQVAKKGGDIRLSQVKELLRLLEAEAKATEKTTEVQQEKVDTINSLKEEIASLEKVQGDQSGAALAATNKEIESLKNQLALLKLIGTAEAQRRDLQIKEPIEAPKAAKIAGTEVGTELSESSLSALDDVFEKTQEKQTKFLESQRAFNEQAAMLAADFITDTVVTFAEGIGQMFAGDFNLEDFGKSLLKAVGGFLASLGKMMIQFGTTALVYSVLAKALANPATAGPAAVGMIAAGAALVAIGSAIGGAAGGGGGAGGRGAITTIDTRSLQTPNTSGITQGLEPQIQRFEFGEAQIRNKTLAIAVNLGQKEIGR